MVDLILAVDRMITALGGIELVTERQHIHSPFHVRTSDEWLGFSGEVISSLCNFCATLSLP